MDIEKREWTAEDIAVETNEMLRATQYQTDEMLIIELMGRLSKLDQDIIKLDGTEEGQKLAQTRRELNDVARIIGEQYTSKGQEHNLTAEEIQYSAKIVQGMALRLSELTGESPLSVMRKSWGGFAYTADENGVLHFDAEKSARMGSLANEQVIDNSLFVGEPMEDVTTIANENVDMKRAVADLVKTAKRGGKDTGDTYYIDGRGDKKILTTREGGPAVASQETTINPVILSADVIPDFDKIKDLKKWLAENLSLLGEVKINSTGKVINITNSGLQKSMKKRGEPHKQTYAKLKEIIANAVYSGFEPRDNQEKHKNTLGQDVYHSAVFFNDKLFAVRIKADIYNGNIANYADHSTIQIEVTPANPANEDFTLRQTINRGSNIRLSVFEGKVKPARYDAETNTVYQTVQYADDRDVAGDGQTVDNAVDLTDDDYITPIRDYVLPNIHPEILNMLGKTQKPLLLKKDIIEKNKTHHKEIKVGENNNILYNATQNTTEILRIKPQEKPNYYTFVCKDGNEVSVIELNETKDNYEIVNWFKVDDKRIKKYEEKARDGGEIVMTDGITKGAARLSALPSPTNSRTHNNDIVKHNHSNIVAKKIEISTSTDPKIIRNDARNYLINKIKKQDIQHPELGKIRVANKGIDEYIHYSGNIDKLALIPHLKELIWTSRLGKKESLTHPRKDNIVAFYPLYNEAVIDGTPYNVTIKIGEDREGNLFYSLLIDDASKTAELAAKASADETSLHGGTRPSITLQKQEGKRNSNAPRGMAYMVDGKTYIKLFKNANASTFIHESAHWFFNELNAIKDLSAQTREMYDKATAWMEATAKKRYNVTAKDGRIVVTDKKGRTVYDMNGKGFASPEYAWLYAENEMFARGFEQYLKEGKAPSNALAKVFGAFKKWLGRIYGTAKNAMGIEINDSIKEVYAKMLGGETLDYYLAESDADVLQKIHELQIKQHNEAVEKALNSSVTEQYIPESTAKALRKAGASGWQYWMKGIDERARDIDERFRNKLNKYEFTMARNLNSYLDRAKPFFDLWQKLSDDDREMLDLALKNPVIKRGF